MIALSPLGRALGLGLLVVALVAGLVAYGSHREKVKQDAARAVAEAEVLKATDAARETATAERAVDAVTTATQKEELTNAVASLPDNLPSPRRVALACERLRQQGTDVSQLAVCGGSGAAR